MDRPNFLIFINDQQRADSLGCMGNTICQTPNIDRIASRGTAFRNCHVNNPLCMPSRATLFTGQTPRGHRCRNNGVPLPFNVPTMTGALSNAGYHTHNVGKIHLRPYAVPRGFEPTAMDPAQWVETRELWDGGSVDRVPEGYYGLDTAEITIGHGSVMGGDYRNWLQREHPEAMKYLRAGYDVPENEAAFLSPPTGADQSWKWAMPEECHPSTWIADRAIAFLKEKAAHPEPFFAFCSFPDPHHPFCPPAPWCDMYRPEDMELPRARREGELDLMPWFYRLVHEKGTMVGGRRDSTNIPDSHLREIIAHTYGMIGLVDKSMGRVLDALEQLQLARKTIVMFLADHGELLGDHGLINKGPFLYQGLTRVPFLVSVPGSPGQPRTADTPVSLLDFAPTVLDLAGVEPEEGLVPSRPESPGQLPPLPGTSLRPLLEGTTDRVRDRCLVEYDEDYLGLRLRCLITDTYRVTTYGGEEFGELFDQENDPDELHNLWDDPRCGEMKRRGLIELLDEIIKTDTVLPRRLTHA